MIWLSIIWGIFALVFLVLGFLHLMMAGKGFSRLQMKQEERTGGLEEASFTIGGVEIEEFLINFNSYIDYYNQTSKKQNRAQAIGYFGASTIAIFSLCIAVFG